MKLVFVFLVVIAVAAICADACQPGHVCQCANHHLGVCDQHGNCHCFKRDSHNTCNTDADCTGHNCGDISAVCDHDHGQSDHPHGHCTCSHH